MTLRMGDGPVANIPNGLDAVAGYVNVSGIGETYKEVVAKFPTLQHLSITTDGMAAMCADVETGAMADWTGYTYGYAAASRVGALILQFGRPKVLWVAHYNAPGGGPPVAHICTSQTCAPGSPVAWTADGTQWTTHDNAWDESLLSDSFFGSPTPPPQEEDMLIAAHPVAGQVGYWICKTDGSVEAFGKCAYHGGNGNAGVKVNGPVTGFSPTPTGLGYYLTNAQGQVYAFGDAKPLGNAV